jgi:hypothetical protein
VAASKNLDPEQRIKRARFAALARTTIEHHIEALARHPLTIEHRRLLANLLVEQPRPDGGES